MSFSTGFFSGMIVGAFLTIVIVHVEVIEVKKRIAETKHDKAKKA